MIKKINFSPEQKKLLLVILLLGIIYLSLHLRLQPARHNDLWLDEVLNFTHGQRPLNVIIFKKYWNASHPQLYEIFLHFWEKVGTSEIILRFPSLIFSIFSIILIFKIGQLIRGNACGLILASLYAYSPFFVNYDWQVNYYSLVTPLMLASIYGFLNLHKKENKWLFLFIFSTVAAFYTDYSTIWYLESILALWLINFILKTRKEWFIKFTLGLVISLILMSFQIPIFIKGFKPALELESYLNKPGWEDLTFFFSQFTGQIIETYDENIYYSLTLFAASFITISYFLIRRIKAKWKNFSKLDIKSNFYLFLLLSFFLPITTSFVFSHIYSPIFEASNLLVLNFLLLFGIGMFLSVLFQKNIFTKILVITLLVYLFYSIPTFSFSTLIPAGPYGNNTWKTLRSKIEQINQSTEKIIVFLGRKDYKLQPLEKYYLKGYDRGYPVKNYKIVKVKRSEEISYLLPYEMSRYIFFFRAIRDWSLLGKARKVLNCYQKYCFGPFSL